MLLRPYGLAKRRGEVPFAAACIALLLLVFISDLLTPVQVAVSAIGLIPLLAALWVLSSPPAALVGAIAIGQLVLTGLLGALSWPTIAAEGSAYLLLGLVCRLYAETLADLFPGRGHPGLPAETTPRLSILQAPGSKGGVRGLDLLTERERQVASLGAQGYTAREIAEQLHIGRRTVETHLANAYGKLGVRSKRELMRARAPLQAAQASARTVPTPKLTVR
jgi:DNA-binding CsgD family transcriptional regulator